jgi:hypothetical protein
MQNIPLQFDLLVLGNEPAGLWLIREFEKIYPKERAIKQTGKENAALGWINIGHPTEDFPLAKSTAAQFGIETHNLFSVEMASANHLFKWAPEKLFSSYAKIPRSMEQQIYESTLPPDSKMRQTLQAALKYHPELLTYAQALWKQIGRSRKATPEMMVWGALQAVEIFQWDPQSLIASCKNLHTFHLSKTDRVISIEQIPNPENKGTLYKIAISNGLSLITKTIVINSNVKQLRQTLRDNEFISWLAIPEDLLSPFSHFPIRLEFDGYHLPKNIKPLTFFMDEEILPEPDLEIWPMTLSKGNSHPGVILWATDRAEFSYEGICKSFGKALNRFQNHFPEALKALKTLSVSLGLESCYSDQDRAQAINEIESSGIELYDLSLLHVRTRKRGIYSLLPALRCNLPYPLGTLSGAREILNELFSRKTLQNYSPKGEQNALSSP